MLQSTDVRVIRFGNFEVDLLSGELRRNGLTVKLQGQPFQVLAILLERPGELVTREEIRQRLWPADTFVDFEHSLNAAVKRLRDSLGDNAEVPVYIETLPRRGYRFISSVDNAASTHSADWLTQHRRLLSGVGLSVALVLATTLVRWTPVPRTGSPSSTAEEGTRSTISAAPELNRTGVPTGTYAASCRDTMVQGKSLTAVCQRLDGSWQSNTLPDWSLCAADIWNVDGFLSCDAEDKLPDPDLDPTGYYTHLSKAEKLERQGSYDAAISEYQRAISVSTPIQGTCNRFWLAHAYGAAGNHSSAAKTIEDATALSVSPASSYCVAQAFASVDKEEALHWLNRARQENDPRMRFVSSDWRFSVLHSDVRFAELANESGK